MKPKGQKFICSQQKIHRPEQDRTPRIDGIKAPKTKAQQDPKPGLYHWVQGTWCQSSCCPGRHLGPAPDSHAAQGTGQLGWPHGCTASSTGHTECHPPTSRCTALPVHQSSASPAQSSMHVMVTASANNNNRKIFIYKNENNNNFTLSGSQ